MAQWIFWLDYFILDMCLKTKIDLIQLMGILVVYKMKVFYCVISSGKKKKKKLA